MTKKKRGIAFTHVVMAYLMNQVAGVQKLHAENDLSRDTIRTAMRELKENGKLGSDLTKWYGETFGTAIGAPQAGEARVYTAQLQKGSPTPFIKLPLPHVKEGDKVEAFFAEDGGVRVGLVQAAAVSDEPASDAGAAS